MINIHVYNNRKHQHWNYRQVFFSLFIKVLFLRAFCIVLQLSKQDPVHTVPLKDYLVSQLRACQEQRGEKFNQLMGLVDPEIVQQLKSFTR